MRYAADWEAYNFFGIKICQLQSQARNYSRVYQRMLINVHGAGSYRNIIILTGGVQPKFTITRHRHHELSTNLNEEITDVYDCYNTCIYKYSLNNIFNWQLVVSFTTDKTSATA